VADVVLLGLFGGLIVGGWSTGFLRRLAGLLYMAASFVLGAWLRAPLGLLVGSFFPAMPKPYAEMIGYSVAFTVLVIAFNLVTGKILSKVAVQGMSKVADKTLGAVLGAVEAALIASAAIVILHTYSAEVAQLARLSGFGMIKDIVDGIDASTIGKILTSTTVPLVLALLGPLLPTDVTTLVPRTIPGLPGGTLPKIP
jgi:uncharacterized membrane protein required for colicin V production